MITPQHTRVLVTAIAMSAPFAALSEPISLKTLDGFTELDGEFVSFNGTVITVDTTVGSISVPAYLVECYSDFCPDGVARAQVVAPAEAPAPPVSFDISFADAQVGDLFLNMLRLKSQQTGMPLRVEVLGPQEFSLTAASSSKTTNLTILQNGATATEGPVVTTQALNGAGDGDLVGPVGWAAPGGFSQHILAVQAYGAVVSRDAGVEALSADDLSRIYAGEITNWAEVGGNDLEIKPIRPAPGMQEHDDMVAVMLTPFGRTLSAKTLTVQDELRAVGITSLIPGAVAVANVHNIAANVPQVAVLDACGAPVVPSGLAISTGAYPMTLVTSATLAATPESEVFGQLFDQVATQTAQLEFVASGYYDMAIETVSPAEKAERVAQIMAADLTADAREQALALITTLFDATQLSMEFNGGSVSATAGALSRANFVRLAEAIEAGTYADQEIMFIGFAHGDQPSDAAIRQSQEAAADMMTAFQAFTASDVTVSSAGFGEIGDQTCSSLGAAQDTHVEVWIRPNAG